MSTLQAVLLDMVAKNLAGAFLVVFFPLLLIIWCIRSYRNLYPAQLAIHAGARSYKDEEYDSERTNLLDVQCAS